MSNMHHKPTAPKSFVIELRQGQLKVEGSDWLPGYTKLHHETKASAIMAAMDKYIDESEVLKKRVEELAGMLDKEMNAESTVVIGATRNGASTGVPIDWDAIKRITK